MYKPYRVYKRPDTKSWEFSLTTVCEYLEYDPFLKVKPATEQLKERGILTPAEVSALIKAPIGDPRGCLVMLLGALCGMRRGEIRGLQWEGIDDGMIKICHNWQNEEGLKVPKCGSTREVPKPDSVGTLLDLLYQQAGFPNKGFVLESKQGVPVSNNFIRRTFAFELEGIGIPGAWHGKNAAPAGYINQQKKRNLTCHGLCHTFVTLGRLAGITDLEIQALAGHKDASMMAHYSHASQVLHFVVVREKLERAIGNVAGV